MKKLFILFFVCAIISNYAIASPFGGYDAGALNSQQMRDLRTHELATRAKNKSAIVTTKTTPLQQQELKQQREQIINADIKSIVFVNNNSISSERLLNVVNDKINKPMTAENIATIRKDIMRYYQNQGFYSAVAMVASQNFKTGELIIEIREGGKNSITIQQ